MLQGLAQAIAEGTVTSEELVAESLQRIDQYNGAINAVVAVDAERALDQARETDRRLREGTVAGPLAGIPILVKDVEDVAGFRTTHGSLTRANAAPAAESRGVPRRLSEAGAIVVGKTNAPEFSFEVYTANRLYGATNNPWQLSVSPGGSSGGSAAALAAGLVPVATGTDGGGSIRIPSAMCGLPGLKPTNGVIARDPIPAWIDLSTDGAMATTIDDIELLLDLTAGPVDGDPGAVPLRALGSDSALAAPKVIATSRTYDWGPLPTEVATAFEAGVTGLSQDLGLEVEFRDPAHFGWQGNPDLDWFVLCCTEQAHLFGKEAIASDSERFDSIFLKHMEYGLSISTDEYLAARRARFVHARTLDSILGSGSILATPTMAVSGFTPDGRMSADAELGIGPEVINTVVQNITGHPAITLPAGLLPNGVPFGLQLTGPRYSDRALLSLARRWFEARPWPLSAPGYRPFSIDTIATH